MIPTLIYGKEGVGKTTSLRNYKNFKAGVAVVQVVPKPLPFKREKGLLVAKANTVDGIWELIKKCPAKSIVIDDAGYLMTMRYMSRARGKGANQFATYDQIADDVWKLMMAIMGDPENDKVVYMMMHEEVKDDGRTGPLTIGKLLDSKVKFPGLFTIILHAVIENKKHVFLTEADDYDVAKSPIDMFSDRAIENDLALVDNTIRDYYNI